MTARTTFLVPAALSLLLAGPAPAGASEPATELRAQVREVQRIHEAEGMAGLEIASRKCWEDTGGFRCLHLDVAAGTLDRQFAGAMGIAGHPYFTAEPLLKRARPVFSKAGWEMEVVNQYLQFLDVSIRAELDR